MFIGLQLVKGNLASQGLKIEEQRLRDSYDRVGLKLPRPCQKTIPRVAYHAEAPLYMWHIDGFHKFDG